MNTQKSEGRTVVRWIALAIQVLLILKGGTYVIFNCIY